MSVREQSHCRVMVNFVSHVVVKGAANLMLFIHCYVYYIVTETPPDPSLVSASDPPPKVEASLPGKASCVKPDADWACVCVCACT